MKYRDTIPNDNVPYSDISQKPPTFRIRRNRKQHALTLCQANTFSLSVVGGNFVQHHAQQAYIPHLYISIHT